MSFTYRLYLTEWNCVVKIDEFFQWLSYNPTTDYWYEWACKCKLKYTIVVSNENVKILFPITARHTTTLWQKRREKAYVWYRLWYPYPWPAEHLTPPYWKTRRHWGEVRLSSKWQVSINYKSSQICHSSSCYKLACEQEKRQVTPEQRAKGGTNTSSQKY